jgi:hypothetical protein
MVKWRVPVLDGGGKVIGYHRQLVNMEVPLTSLENLYC